jgi:hypothetical protein
MIVLASYRDYVNSLNVLITIELRKITDGPYRASQWGKNHSQDIKIEG